MQKIPLKRLKGIFMKSFKTLNISGALLDNNQFFKYIENISAEHIIKKSLIEIHFQLNI